jgi:two-component system, NarL family, sensor kinase
VQRLKIGKSGALHSRLKVRLRKAPYAFPDVAVSGADILLDDTERAEGDRWLAAKLLQVQESERGRIARELHDVINQKLALLVIELGTLSKNAVVPDSVREDLLRLRGETEALTRDVRRLSHQLHPATLEHLGLIPALQSFCQQFAQREHIELTFHNNANPAPVRPEIALGLFRIAQEALRNVAKHSRAHKARVDLEVLTRKLTLEIRDDGIGFAATTTGRSGGIGLASMRERAALAGGELQVHSRPGAGTTIRVEIKLPGLYLSHA